MHGLCMRDARSCFLHARAGEQAWPTCLSPAHQQRVGAPRGWREGRERPGGRCLCGRGVRSSTMDVAGQRDVHARYRRGLLDGQLVAARAGACAEASGGARQGQCRPAPTDARQHDAYERVQQVYAPLGRSRTTSIRTPKPRAFSASPAGESLAIAQDRAQQHDNRAWQRPGRDVPLLGAGHGDVRWAALVGVETSHGRHGPRSCPAP